MGKNNQSYLFQNNAGGLNESVSDFQMNNNEATIAQNVYFENFSNYGSVIERKGRTKINTGLGFPTTRLWSFTLNGATYLHAGGGAGIADVNIDTGAKTDITLYKAANDGGSLSDDSSFDTAALNSKLFLIGEPSTTVKEDCEATTGFTNINAETITVSTSHITRVAGSYSLEVKSEGLVAAEFGVYKTYTTFNLTNNKIYFNIKNTDQDLAGRTVRITISSDLTKTN